jgi:phosphoenolpyruvate-protein kinase (PTS system EI component)
MSQTDGWTQIASGLFASAPADVEGPVRIINGLDDIKALMKDAEADACVAVTEMAGGSAVSTIIKRTKAIVSTIGGPHSHIVVVARDYGVPCIVGAAELDLGSLVNGTQIRLGADGSVSVKNDA